MKEIFPQEIIDLSIEKHFSRFSKKTNLIYRSVLIVFVCAAISLFFIHTEITVQCRGILRSSEEPIALCSPVGAEVNRCELVENKLVNKGDTVLWMNTEKLDKSIEHLENMVKENELYLKDISKMLARKYADIKTDLFQAQYEQYWQQLSEHNLNVKAHEVNYNRSKILLEKNVIPRTEMENKEFILSKAVEQKQNFERKSRKELEQQAVRYKLENKKYHQEISILQNELHHYSIIAPEKGHITNYSGVKEGSYLMLGQKVALISCDNSLIAEHLVSPRDIAYLQKDMPVLFQVDAYNYNQWGLASGKIIEISKEVYFVNNTPYFKVRCSLNEKELLLKNGYSGQLIKGLTATARFQVTKRTLAQLLFDKTDKWLNPRMMNS